MKISLEDKGFITDHFFSQKNFLKPHIILLSFIVLLIYSNSLRNGFVYDDNTVLVGNRVFKEFDIKEIFFGLPFGVEYFPVRDLSFAVDFAIWDENPFGFHLSNLILYLLFIAILYYFILELNRLLLSEINLEKSGIIAFITAALFAVHPIHSEPVNFITARGTLMSGAFFVLSCLYYLKFMRERAHWGNYLLVLLFFVLSMLSKSYSIILPLVLSIFEFYPRERRLKNSLYLLPVFGLSFAFYIFFKFVAVKTGVVIYQNIGFRPELIAGKLSVAVQIPFFYLSKIVLPMNLSAEYDVRLSTGMADPVVILGFLAIAGIFLISLALKKRFPYLLFGFFWFFLTLIPFLQVLPTGTLLADRYIFIPSFPFFYILAVSLTALSKNSRFKFLTLLIAMIWGISALNQNRVWASDVSLWSRTIRNNPYWSRAYVDLGCAYLNMNDADRAFKYFKKAGEIDPSDNSYDFQMGKMALNAGRYDEALKFFNMALNRKNSDLNALLLTGLSYEKMGMHVDAAEAYNKVLTADALDPGRVRDMAKEGLKGVWETVSPQLQDMRRRVKENPGDPRLIETLAITLDRLGHYKDAVKAYDEVRKVTGERWEVFYNIANVYKKMGDLNSAEINYNNALRLNPKDPRILNSLGLIYKTLGETEKAARSFEQAIAYDPGFGFAPFNLATLYFQMGEREKALYYFRYTMERFPDMQPQVIPYMKELR